MMMKLVGFRYSDNFGIVQLFGWIAYVLLLVGIILFTYILVVRRFYSNTFGAEGYLTNTLPVESWHILVSKLLMGVIWSVLSIALLYGSILFIVQSINVDILKFINSSFTYLLQDLYTSTKVVYIVSLILSPFASILLFYTACCLGQLFSRRRVLAAVLIYLGLTFVLNIFSSVLTALVVGGRESSDLAMSIVNLSMTVIEIGAGFWLSNYIMKRQLNLE